MIYHTVPVLLASQVPTRAEGNLTGAVEEEYKENQPWPTSGPSVAVRYIIL